ncbi:MAG TPA: preprotein translocase subunit YajC [Gammaproteobacteria bacterium]|nr:preprotein translocase subunit YajC [Gammaproteobacteria bacterium]
MSFFIRDALAAAPAAPAQPDPFTGLLPLLLIFVVFYFLLIRPQTKRAKEHKAMVEALARGDEVVTNGGLLGRITALDENYVTLKVADGVEVRVQRQAIASLLPKGSSKD